MFFLVFALHCMASYLSVAEYLVNLWLLFSDKSCPPLFTPWTAALQASPSFTISQSLLRVLCIESVMLSSHLILCHPFSS